MRGLTPSPPQSAHDFRGRDPQDGPNGLAQSLVSKTVASMRDEGVLMTTPDPSDGRRILVSVDPAIRDILNSRGARPVDVALSHVRPGTSAAEIQRINELLDELATRLLS